MCVYIYVCVHYIYITMPRTMFYIYRTMQTQFSHVQLFATPWTIAHQAPLSMGFSRQEYCSGLPCPSPIYKITFHELSRACNQKQNLN